MAQNKIKYVVSHAVFWVGFALFAISLVMPAYYGTSGYDSSNTFVGYNAALTATFLLPLIFGGLEPVQWLYIGLPLANPLLLFSRSLFNTNAVKIIKWVLIYYFLLAIGAPFLFSEIKEVFVGYYLWTFSIITISLSYFIRDNLREKDDTTDTKTSKKRPSLVWVISIYTFFYSLWFISTVLIFKGELRVSIFGLLVSLMNIIGAIYLLLLRRYAYYLFLVAFIISLLSTAYIIIVQTLTTGVSNWLNLTYIAISFIISVAIILYLKSLLKKEILQ